mgnify:CR=1 FL=1
MKPRALTIALTVLVAIALMPQTSPAGEPRTAYGRVVKSNLPPMPEGWKEARNPEPVVPLEERCLARPVVDAPLRDPSVCKGPDPASSASGESRRHKWVYYLTGTTPRVSQGGGIDWDKGTEIRLWKSTDLKTWKDVGVVWDLTKAGWTREAGNAINWAKGPRAKSGVVDSLRHSYAVTAPEIHYLKDTYWITFSVSDCGTGLLKSTTGKAEGPYEVWGQIHGGVNCITTTGADPSLFQDDDGKVYWLWSPAWIARMTDDLSALAETPRLLQCAPGQEPNGTDILVGRRGPVLFKANGIYHLCAADLMLRLGIQVEDTLVATSKNLFGPYSKRLMMIPHGGQTTVFQDAEGNYHATVCGHDRYAAVRDQAGIVRLEWMKGWRYQFHLPDGVLRTNPQKTYTERGPWHKMLPLFDKPGLYIRDNHMMQGPDGYFYVSGSVYGEPYVGKMPIFRSRDLKNWEEIIVRTFDDDTQLPDEMQRFRMRTKDGKINLGSWENYYMSVAVNWVPKLKTFAISYERWFQGYKGNIPPNAPNSGYLISATGRGEGPYERVPTATGVNCSKFFQDDDGTFYNTGGCNFLNRLNDDFSRKKSLTPPRPPSGCLQFEDSGCGLVKMHGKYLFFTITCAPSNFRGQPCSAADYGSAYLQADSPEGPWSEWMPGPRHCAWGFPFRGLDGHWYASPFGEDILGGFHQKVGLVRLKTELRDAQVLMDVDDDWTPDDYLPVGKWQGQGEWSPYSDTASRGKGE